ncbi:hypothetical protein [Methanobrevibacter oralis]|uniref:hypothetical protein n=1 Tax=Methanobrevibacter oralis TaxID=66851 RepID=UPI000B1837E1|nr:hypothetical protein [Methanobrevibacter oralis]
MLVVTIDDNNGISNNPQIPIEASGIISMTKKYINELTNNAEIPNVKRINFIKIFLKIGHKIILAIETPIMINIEL